MAATIKNLILFYWHCEIAARIIDEMPQNAATSSVSRHAVRMATLNLFGKHGVPFASAEAIRVQKASGKPWDKCGLVREHSVPLSILHAMVVAKVKRPMTESQMDRSVTQLRRDMKRSGLSPETIEQFPLNTFTWRVVQVLRKWTHLAWVTKLEDKQLKAKLRDGTESLNKRMPPDWDEIDCLARYRYWKIKVRAI